MLRSLFSGISGLRNFQVKMDVIGNNIANVNTIGYKGSRITFADTISQMLSNASAPTEEFGGRNPIQVGLGMSTKSIDTDFSQGALESTGILTDLAIQGNGFFMVSKGDRDYYTRAGSFNIDTEGHLVMSGSGYRLKGYMLGLGGELDKISAVDLQIPIDRKSPAQSTSEVNLYGNLDMNMTEALATLRSGGDTGISHVSGTAVNGVGGVHSIEVTGLNASQSSLSGATNGINLSDTLEDLGISDLTGFSITVDNDRVFELSGLSLNSSVADLISAINDQIDGVEAELDENGAIAITRSFHGDGSQYNVQLNDGVEGSDLVATLFDNSGTFDVNNGTESTLVAVDSFTANNSTDVIRTSLVIDFDERTGLAVGLLELGGGGVDDNAPVGLAAGTAEIYTEDTTHATSIFVYDSLGNTHNLTINFTRTPQDGLWRWSVDLTEPAVVFSGGSGEISFKDDGSLENLTYDNDAAGLVINPGNGAQNIELTLNAGTFGELDGLTMSASPMSAQAVSQDGYGMGDLLGLIIDVNGNIHGNYSNGLTEILAQVLLADFINPDGLDHLGENLFGETLNSGEARVNEASITGSKINSGYLEMSNVDLAREFTEMIMAQRAFQAAARVITTSDALLQEITTLKR